MNVAPDSSVRSGVHSHFVYLLDDRVEIGTMGLGFAEELRRVAYRDVRSVMSWSARRDTARFLGWICVALTLLISLIALGAGSEDGALIVFGIGTLVSTGMLFFGRAGALTRVRIESTRGTLETVVGGSLDRREALVSRLAELIQERQRTGR